MTEQRTGTLRLLTWALHAAVAVLLLIGVIRLLGGPSGGATERGGWQIALGCATAVLFALAYAWGSVPNRFTSPRAARWWLAGVTACWVLLMVFAAEFAWLAFPLFFLHLHLLRRWHAVVAIVVMTIMVIAAQGLHAGRLQVAMVLGPIVGAAFSVVGALAYEALYAESAARAASLAELRATRAELARSQREAGRLGEQERLPARSTTPSPRASARWCCWAAVPAPSSPPAPRRGGTGRRGCSPRSSRWPATTSVRPAVSSASSPHRIWARVTWSPPSAGWWTANKRVRSCVASCG